MQTTKDREASARARRRPGAAAACAGFTLIEIMVVLAIIGLIAAAVSVKAWSIYTEGQMKAAKLQVTAVAQAALQARMSGECPRDVGELVAQHRISQRQTRDPWGHELGLRCPGRSETDGVDVWSAGADGKPDTADDIVSGEGGAATGTAPPPSAG